MHPVYNFHFRRVSIFLPLLALFPILCICPPFLPGFPGVLRRLEFSCCIRRILSRIRFPLIWTVSPWFCSLPLLLADLALLLPLKKCTYSLPKFKYTYCHLFNSKKGTDVCSHPFVLKVYCHSFTFFIVAQLPVYH